MCNTVIRIEAKENGVKLWQIAEALGIRDYTLSRKLRRELTVEEQENILNIIQKLGKET